MDSSFEVTVKASVQILESGILASLHMVLTESIFKKILSITLYMENAKINTTRLSHTGFNQYFKLWLLDYYLYTSNISKSA